MQMMTRFKIVLFAGIFVFNYLTTAQNSTGNTTPSSELQTTLSPSTFSSASELIYAVYYNVSEANASALVFDLLSENVDYINAQDVLSLLESHNLVVPATLLEVDLLTWINNADISMLAFVRNITEFVPPPKGSNIRSVLRNFNINSDEYADCVVENDDNCMLDLMKTGIYTEESIQNALSIVGKSEVQMLELIKPMLVDGWKRLPLFDIVENYYKELQQIFIRSNITLQEINKYDSFRVLLKNFTESLNEEVTWATAISPRSLVTVRGAVDKISRFRNKIDTYLVNVQTSAKFINTNMSDNDTFSIITVNEDLTSYIPANYAELSQRNDCYTFVYTTELTNETLRNPKFEKSTVVAETRTNVTYSLGTPLICESFLYGLLTQNREDSLTFLKVSGNFVQDNDTDIADGSERQHIEVFMAGIMLSVLLLL